MTNAFVNGFFDECKSLAQMSKQAQAAPATDNKWLVPLIASGVGAIGGGLMSEKKKRLQGMLMGALGGAAAGWGGQKIYDQGNQIKGLQGDVASRDQRITGLEGDVASRDSTIRQQGDHISGLEGQLQDRQNQIDTMRGTIAGNEGTINDLRGQVTGLNNQVTGLNKSLEDRAAEIAGLNGQLSDRDQQIIGLTGDIGHRDQQISDLTGQVEGLNGQVTGLNDQLTANAARIKELEGIAGWKTPAKEYLDSLAADRKNLADRNAVLQGYLDTVDATGQGVAARDQNVGQFAEDLLTARSMLEGRPTPGGGLTSDQLRATADQLVSAKGNFPVGERGEGLAREMKMMADVMDGIADQDTLIAQLKADIEAAGGTADAQALAQKLAQLQAMVKQVQAQMEQQKKQQAAELAKNKKALEEAEKQRKGMKLPTPYSGR